MTDSSPGELCVLFKIKIVHKLKVHSVQLEKLQKSQLSTPDLTHHKPMLLKVMNDLNFGECYKIRTTILCEILYGVFLSVKIIT